jgi:hypothetical protein
MKKARDKKCCTCQNAQIFIRNHSQDLETNKKRDNGVSQTQLITARILCKQTTPCPQFMCVGPISFNRNNGPSKWADLKEILSQKLTAFDILFNTTQPHQYWHNNNNNNNKTIFCAPQRPDRLRAPPASYTTATLGSLPGCKKSWGVKLTTHLHPLPRSRMVELYLHSPISLHGMMFNYLRTGTNLFLLNTGFWGCNITVSIGIKKWSFKLLFKRVK